MKTYFDRFNFLHDKPCIDGKASSGNPLIYSALYECVTHKFTAPKSIYLSHFIDHSILGNNISIIRHPDKLEPASLDEIIGAIYLGFINNGFLSNYDYRWHDTLHSPKWYRVLQAAIYCAGKHRNFFKDNNVRDLHPIAYWCPWHIQYYAIKQKNKNKFMPFCTIMFYLWLISVIVKKNYKSVSLKGEKWYKPWYKLKKHPKREKQTGSISQKNILWLILKDLDSKWLIKLLDWKQNLRDYFEDEDHPILRSIK